MGKRASQGIWSLTILLLIAALIWVIRFWHSPQFGLYEDDYTRIPQALSMAGSELWNIIVQSFRYFVDHGKPLHPTLIYSLALIGGRINGLFGVYLIGYFLVTLNAFLFYWLIKRVSDQTFALISVLAYILYSADTTQAFITHSLGLQPSLTFLLLAMHCYLSDKKILSYILVAGILINYETPFFVFLGTPLLKKKWDKDLIKEFIVNAIVLGGILLVVLLIRTLIGESRVTGLGFPGVITTPIIHMLQGPFVSMGTYLYRPIQTVLAFSGGLIIPVLFGFLLICLVLSRAKLDKTQLIVPIIEKIRRFNLGKLIASLKEMKPSSHTLEDIPTVGRLSIAGVVMLVLAYPLTFTVRAYAISGRDTRVHFAAVIGASILLTCIIWIALKVAQEYGKRRIGTFAISGFLSILVGFGFIVQEDYVQSWKYQQEFWTQVVELCPDLEKDTVILVDPAGLRYTRHIDANTWNLPRVLPQIYKFPSYWEWFEKPRVYRLVEGWEDRIIQENLEFDLSGATTIAPPSYYQTVEPSNVILLFSDDGVLSRQIESINLNGQDFELRGFSEEIQDQYDFSSFAPYLLGP